MQDVLKVDEVSYINGNRWLVKGRAWEELHVGDTVYSAVGREYKTIIEKDRAYSILLESDEDLIPHAFTIVAISTYRRDVELLDKGLTGELMIEGAHGEDLEKTSLLVKL